MGLFDTVHIKCPHCGHGISKQIKTGDNRLEDYYVETAPLDILAEVEHMSKNKRLKCPECENPYSVFVQAVVTVTKGVKEDVKNACAHLTKSGECRFFTDTKTKRPFVCTDFWHCVGYDVG